MIAVTYAFDAGVLPGRQRVHASSLDFETTLARLKAAVVAENMWVLAELDPQMLLRKEGYSIEPARQILYFHPRFMSRLLATNTAAIVEAPLKLVVMADADGKVSVRHLDIVAAFAGYAGMSALAQELAELTERIVRTTAGS